jgi:murein DD-endopeptidase MepM/ murein hydrolase activator NlpD
VLIGFGVMLLQQTPYPVQAHQTIRLPFPPLYKYNPVTETFSEDQIPITDACANGTGLGGHEEHKRAAKFAVDFGMRVGTPIYAPVSGSISYAEYNTTGYGYLIKLQESNSTREHWLGHLSKFYVAQGANVQQGQLIALSGNTGPSAAHLHYHVQRAGANIDENADDVRAELPDIDWDYTDDYCDGDDEGEPGDGVDGYAQAAHFPNGYTNHNCAEFYSLGLSGVWGFDAPNCQGNVVFGPLYPFPEAYNLAQMQVNDRLRSISTRPGTHFYLYGNTSDDTLWHCHERDMWNLDTDGYNGSETHIGWDNNYETYDAREGAGTDSVATGYNMVSRIYITIASCPANQASRVIADQISTGVGIGGGGIYDAITVFGDPGYSGTNFGWVDPSSGWINFNSSNGPDYMNDLISSISITSGWSLLVAENFDGGGGQKCFVNSVSDMAYAAFSNGTNADNKISSVKVFNNSNCSGQYAEGVAANDTVTVYNDAGYFSLQYGWHYETYGNVPGHVQNQITSVGVTPGWSVALYNGQDLDGGLICLSASDSDLSDNWFDDDSSANNAIESFYVFDNPTCGSLNSPPTLSLVTDIQNPVTGMLQATVHWTGSALKPVYLYWGDGSQVQLSGRAGIGGYTHQYATGSEYTVTLSLQGKDGLTYSIFDRVNMPTYTCGEGVEMPGIVLFDYMNCAYGEASDMAGFEQPGLYDLSDYDFNNKATSIHLPQDGSMSARLYSGEDGTGQSVCRSVYDMWNMAEDLWEDDTPMDNTVSSLEIFNNDTCTPPPDMSMTYSFLNPNGEIQLNVSWAGGDDTWQMIDWGDNTDYGVHEPSGDISPTHGFPGPGTYTVTFTVINQSPDFAPFTLTQDITVNDYDCGTGVSQTGVTLYRFSDCAYRDETDFEEFTTTGTFNLTGVDNDTTSIHVPTGQSVMLYEGTNQTGESSCTSWDMWYLGGVNWPSQAVMNDTISSIKIFNNTTCTE